MQHLRHADSIIVLSTDGNVASHGTFDELKRSNSYFQSLLIKDHRTDEENVIENEQMHQSTAMPLDEADIDQEWRVDELSRATGDVTLYKYYIQSIGGLYCSLFFGLYICYIFCVSFPRKSHGFHFLNRSKFVQTNRSYI